MEFLFLLVRLHVYLALVLIFLSVNIALMPCTRGWVKFIHELYIDRLYLNQRILALISADLLLWTVLGIVLNVEQYSPLTTIIAVVVTELARRRYIYALKTT